MSENAIAGALSGFISRMITAPLDVIKIRFQLQSNIKQKYVSLSQSVRLIIQEEGVLGLWKGNIPGMFLWGSYSLLQFTSYDVYKSLFTVSDSVTLSPTMINILAGGSAASTATALTYPFDIMRTQFAIQGKEQIYRSMFHYCRQTFLTKGIPGFYAGMSAALLSVAPYMGLNFGLYELINSQLSHHFNQSSSLSFSPSFLISLFSGGMSGGLSKILVYPLDTIKKRLQSSLLINTVSVSVSVSPSLHGVQSSHTSLKYYNFRTCLLNIWREEGVRGYYKGLTPTLLKSILSTSIAFGTFKLSKEFLEISSKGE